MLFGKWYLQHEAADSIIEAMEINDVKRKMRIGSCLSHIVWS
jgi:hypothetical protein